MLYKITEQQMQDYISCPVYYNFRYNNKYTISTASTLPKLLNKVTSGFFMKLADGKLMSAYDVKRKWDMICTQNSDIIDAKKNLDGFHLLNNMYRWAESEQLIVAAEQLPYTYELNFNSGKDHCSLTGVLRTIIKNKRGFLEYLIVDYGSRLTDQSLLDMDLKTTIDCAVFEKVYGKPILGCKVHNVKYNKDSYTTRCSRDYERLNSSLLSIVKGISNNIIFPRQTPLCSSCRVKDFCIGWS